MTPLELGLLILGHAARVAGQWIVGLTWWDRHGAPIQWYVGATLIAGARAGGDRARHIVAGF